jgi:hypothetical protein
MKKWNYAKYETNEWIMLIRRNIERRK